MSHNADVNHHGLTLDFQCSILIDNLCTNSLKSSVIANMKEQDAAAFCGKPSKIRIPGNVSHQSHASMCGVQASLEVFDTLQKLN